MKDVDPVTIKWDAVAVLVCGDIIHTKPRKGIDSEDVDLFGEIQRRTPKIAKWGTQNGISVSALMPLVDARTFLDLFAAWEAARPVVREVQLKAATMAGQGSKQLKRRKKEGEALYTLNEHPNWSNRQISEDVGCHIKSLSRWSAFKELRKMQTNSIPPRGHKARDGDIEAYSEDSD
jgi:hypothetical protein